jgi:hypothetical protein
MIQGWPGVNIDSSAKLTAAINSSCNTFCPCSWPEISGVGKLGSRDLDDELMHLVAYGGCSSSVLPVETKRFLA